MAAAIGMLAFGAALLIATRLVYDASPARGGTVELLLKLTASIMLAVGLFGTLFRLSAVAGLFIWFGSGVVLAMTLVQLRINRQRALLGLLALAAEKQMPLTSVVKAFAADQPAGSRRRLEWFAADLQSGTPLGEALLRTPSVVPRQAVVMAQMGERTGTLSSALRHAASAYSGGVPLRQALVGRTFYLAWLAFMIPFIFAFVAIKIFPAYVAIFRDFEVELPATTIVLFKLMNIGVVQWVGGLGPLVGTAVFGYFVLYFIGVVPAPKLGFGLWTERPQILRALAMAVESQYPLGEALDRLAESYPSKSIARRLHKAATDIMAGRDWAQTLVKYSLIGKGAAAVVQSGQRVGNLPWAMRQVAEASERRLAYRLEAALNVISPLVILDLAAVVALFVFGCFLPLVKLIMSLT